MARWRDAGGLCAAANPAWRCCTPALCPPSQSRRTLCRTVAGHDLQAVLVQVACLVDLHRLTSIQAPPGRRSEHITGTERLVA